MYKGQRNWERKCENRLLFISASKWVGFNIVWSVLYTSIASIITLDYCLYHDDPLSGRQRVVSSPKPPSVGVATVAHVGVATLW